jgi:dTDP-4-dehydrorhamnose 3,5-epimerase-like enzyme|tara:strand:- start:13916 stop:14338 length:423 start_codon:yes stop_codon:yes gene_type:complete
MRKVYKVSDILIVKFPLFAESNGSLLVMEGGDVVPFEIARVFLVKADAGAIRGNHAHYECFQLLQCNNGSVSVRCDDGDKSVDFSLGEPNQGLLIPPGIWASQTYNDSNSILVVLCDQPFSETDYMRDYDEYLRYRKNLI